LFISEKSHFWSLCKGNNYNFRVKEVLKLRTIVEHMVQVSE